MQAMVRGHIVRKHLKLDPDLTKGQPLMYNRQQAERKKTLERTSKIMFDLGVVEDRPE